MTRNELKTLFTYHPADEQQQLEVMAQIRKQALNLAGNMLLNSPASAEQTIAIRKVWEALAYFNLSVTMPRSAQPSAQDMQPSAQDMYRTVRQGE